ncbi:acetoacetate decarboxylase family protein [Alteromonas sp. NFXS44]|uniref:acetoacetate decarboxylase family protein n=1 Tax=Alteromonas sp. NFXS44 TaxID=2818435 RepID=UPI0032DFFC47
MAFKPEKGNYYRMPVFFGPTPGPRQFKGIENYDWETLPKRHVLGARFLTDAKMLESWLPEGFSLWGEPVVTCEATYFDGFGWLAGRGYNMCDLKLNVVFESENGPVHGTFLVVRYENLTDPILSGREELGHNKLWCKIPPVRDHEGKKETAMSWLGTTFWKISASDLSESTELPKSDPKFAGLLSYKHIPTTGNWGDSDASYVTLTPPAWNGKVIRRLEGSGNVEFIRPKWEDLPTMYHMIDAFCDLPQLESRGGYFLEMEGGASGSETHRID